MRRAVLYICFIVVVVAAAQAHAGVESAAALYNRGNALYMQGQFDDAILVYKQAIKEGARDPRLEYNLANSYLKNAPPDLGRAMLHYERARLLDPRDPDILYNLNFADSLIKDKPPVGELTYLQISWEKLMSRISTTEAAAVFSFLYMVLIFMIVLRILARTDRVRTYLRSVIVLIVFILALDFPFFASKIRHASQRKAVVIEARIKARSGPGETNQELFSLPAGTVLHRKECRGKWCQAEVPGGMSGWVPRNGIEPVIPEIRN